MRQELFARETNWPKNIVISRDNTGENIMNNKNFGNMPNLKYEGGIKRNVLLPFY